VPRSLIVMGSGSKMVRDLTPVRVMFFAVKWIGLRRSESECPSLTDFDSSVAAREPMYCNGPVDTGTKGIFDTGDGHQCHAAGGTPVWGSVDGAKVGTSGDQLLKPR